MYKAVAMGIVLLLFLLGVVAGLCFTEGFMVGPSGEGFEVSVQVEVTSNKVTYEPGEDVVITVFVKNKQRKPLENVDVDFVVKDALGTPLYDASEVIDQIGVASVGRASVVWRAGDGAPRGYALDVVVKAGGGCVERGRVVFDVADWTRVPRYGFFAVFGYKGLEVAPDEAYVAEKVADMAKFHINCIQFYDWFEYHGNYAPQREGRYNIRGLSKRIDAEKVLEKVDYARRFGMKCMAYVVVYTVADLISDQHPDWALTDEAGKPLTFGGDDFVLYYVNPARECGWHDFAMDQFKRSMRLFGWDGVHIDQYDSFYSAYWRGAHVDLTGPIIDFVDDAREAVRQVDADAAAVFNAINTNPSDLIKRSKQDFVYVETWTTPSYGDVASLVRRCRAQSGGKAVVLAAYTPHSSSKSAILLLDAVIFANQGLHIEVGEGNCILADPYFPEYDVLPAEVVEALRKYYGHITRYGEYIYGGDVESVEDGAVVTNFPCSATPEADKVYVVNYRRVQGGEPAELISHLVNFRGVGSMSWKGPQDKGQQPVPTELRDVQVRVPLPEGKRVVAVYLASPDLGVGDPEGLGFSVEGGFVGFTVPSLSYWSTVIVKLA